jgi:hypothetical protein
MTKYQKFVKALKKTEANSRVKGLNELTDVVIPYDNRVREAVANEPGLLAALVSSLKGGQDEAEAAALVLRSISLADAAKMVTCQQDGLIDAVVSVVRAGSLKAKEHACVVLQNIACGKKCKESLLQHPGLIDLLMATMQQSKDDRTRAAACATIQNIAYHEKTREPLLKHAGLINLMVETMKEGDSKTREFACGTIQKISNSARCATPILIHEGLASALLVALKESTRKETRIRAFSTLDNIAKVESLHFSMYCAPGLVETLFSIAADDDHALQPNCKELLSKITPDAAAPPPPPPPARPCRASRGPRDRRRHGKDDAAAGRHPRRTAERRGDSRAATRER